MEDFIEDGYTLNPEFQRINRKRYTEKQMIEESAKLHTDFYKGIYKLNAELENAGEPVQTVRVMTQNMHARPEPFELTTGAQGLGLIDTCDPAYNFENRQTDRVKNIVKGIKNLADEIKPHVICFQELQGTKDLIMEENLTKLTNPRDSFAYKREVDCTVWNINRNQIEYDADMQGNVYKDKKGNNIVLTNKCLASSPLDPKNYPGGLTTYSTLPIVFQTYYIFAVGTGGEQVVNKGALYSKILISKPGRAEKYINIFNCHPLAPITFSRGECENGLLNSPNNCSMYQLRQFQNEQLREIYNFKLSLEAGGYIDKDELVVYAGDMNINQYMALWETDQQKKIETASVCCGEEFYSMLSKLHAEHPPVYLNPLPSKIGGQGGIGGHNGIFTWDGEENSITKSLLWPESYTWIDYVLYSITNARPMYADNFVVRFKQTNALYERGKVYQQDCFNSRAAKIQKLDKTIPLRMADVQKNFLTKRWPTTWNTRTHPANNALERLKTFQESVYGDAFIKAVQKDPTSFYKNKPLLLKKGKFLIDDNPKTTKQEDGFFYTNTAIEDVSDHYGVIATFILPSTKSKDKFNNLMKKRFNENVHHELFFNLPLQPIVIGINNDGKALRLASRMDPRSPKMDETLWLRQTGTLQGFSSDERVQRAAYISSMNATAAMNDRINFSMEPRIKGPYEYSDCPDNNSAECQRLYPDAFETIPKIRPILTMGDLNRMKIADIHPDYNKRMREPRVINLVGLTPTLRRSQRRRGTPRRNRNDEEDA